MPRAQKVETEGNKLLIETTAPREFLGTIMKQINVSLMNGYDNGEGELGRVFRPDTPYTYSYQYSEDE